MPWFGILYLYVFVLGYVKCADHTESFSWDKGMESCLLGALQVQKLHGLGGWLSLR